MLLYMLYTYQRKQAKEIQDSCKPISSTSVGHKGENSLNLTCIILGKRFNKTSSSRREHCSGN